MSKTISRKSFVLHNDSLDILDDLTDEQAGKLFKAISTYHKIGKIIDLDQLLKIAITPFLNQFKRDDENWTKTKEERSLSGRIGNLKRWNNDLYKQFEVGKITLKEAENIAKSHKKSLSDNSESLKSLSDNSESLKSLNVNVNVNENVSVNNKEIKLNLNSPPQLKRKKKEGGGGKKNLENDDFKNFWNGYIPVKKTNGRVKEKGSKKTAKLAYVQALLSNYTPEQILEGSKIYLKNCQQNNILSCEVVTFLNDERFLNEYGSAIEAEATIEELNHGSIALLEYSQVLKIARNFSDTINESYLFENLITNAVVIDFGGIESISKTIKDKDGYSIKPDLSYFKHDFQETWLVFNKTDQTSDEVSGKISKLIHESNWKGEGAVWEKNPIIKLPDLSIQKQERLTTLKRSKLCN